MPWLKLHPKIAAALAAAVTVDGASVLAAWNGTVTWHETIGVIIGSAVTTAAGYLKGVSPDA